MLCHAHRQLGNIGSALVTKSRNMHNNRSYRGKKASNASHMCACGMHTSVIFHLNIRATCRAKRLPPVTLQPEQPLAKPPAMPLVAAGNVRHRPGPLAPPKTVVTLRGTVDYGSRLIYFHMQSAAPAGPAPAVHCLLLVHCRRLREGGEGAGVRPAACSCLMRRPTRRDDDRRSRARACSRGRGGSFSTATYSDSCAAAPSRSVARDCSAAVSCLPLTHRRGGSMS